jgi:CRISPR system Cascade subunit CasE
MYLNKVQLTDQGGESFGSQKGSGLYAYHQILWKLFEKDEDADLDFLFQKNEDGSLLVLSERPPIRENPYFEVVSKKFNPVFRAGQVVQFRLTANPVERIEEGGKRKKAGILTHAHHQAKKDNRPFNQREAVQEEGKKWLEKRQEACGFELMSVRVLSYEKKTFSKGGKSSRITLDIMQLEGMLQIVDPEKFWKALKKGIGPSPAFGCGMMLVAPA